MKITLDIPDTTMCAFYSYAIYGPNTNLIGTRVLDSDDLKDGALIKVQPEGENGNE